MSSDDGTSLLVPKTAGCASVTPAAQIKSAAPASAKVAKPRSAGKGKHTGLSKASSRPTAPPAPREVTARDRTLPKQRQQGAPTARPVVSGVQDHGPPCSRSHLLRPPCLPSTCVNIDMRTPQRRTEALMLCAGERGGAGVLCGAGAWWRMPYRFSSHPKRHV